MVRGRKVGEISVGGVLLIVGIALMIVSSFWLGLIVALVGHIALAAPRKASAAERGAPSGQWREADRGLSA